jgi:hypothetical protein
MLRVEAENEPSRTLLWTNRLACLGKSYTGRPPSRPRRQYARLFSVCRGKSAILLGALPSCRQIAAGRFFLAVY